MIALLVAVAFATAVSAFAQLSQDPTWRPRIWVGGGRFYRTPPKWARRADNLHAVGVNTVIYSLTH